MEKIVIISPPGNTAERMYSMRDIGMLSKILTLNDNIVKVIDCIEYSNNLQKILEIIKKEKPAFIFGIFMWAFLLSNNFLIQLFEEINKIKDNALIIAFGRAATIRHETLLINFKSIQIAVIGEGEKTIPELIALIKNGKDFTKQKGIAYVKGENIVLNERQEQIHDLDTLPLPDHSYLKNRKLYPIAPLYTSRYCYGQCKFCINKLYHHAHTTYEYRARSVDSVIAEIEEIINNYNVNIFYFVDDNFFVDGEKGKSRAIDFAEKIIKKNLKISYFIESRVNDVEIELFTLLKKSGLRKVFLGIESGSQTFLDRYHKETTISKNEVAINILRKLSINFEPGFIMFEPYSTIEDLKQNINFIKKNNLHLINYATSNPLLNPMNLYDDEFHKELINYSKENVVNNDYSIPYSLIDDKVQEIFINVKKMNNILKNFNKTFNDYLNKINIQFQNNNTNRILKENAELNKKLVNIKYLIAKWFDHQSELSIDLFEKIVAYIDEKVINNIEADKINKIIKDEITNFHFKYFNCSFEENKKNIESLFFTLSDIN